MLDKNTLAYFCNAISSSIDTRPEQQRCCKLVCLSLSYTFYVLTSLLCVVVSDGEILFTNIGNRGRHNTTFTTVINHVVY
jgi:hypothetical protein